MHLRHAFALLVLLPAIALSGASCQQILGIEKAYLRDCPFERDCTVCEDDDDCDSATECHSWSCRGNLCVPLNVAVRTQCATGVCSDDWASECVKCVENEDCPAGGYCYHQACFRCDDGIQNGDEHAVDCGGECKACQGEPCTSPDECVSGFCADFHCCNGECTEDCASCNNPEGDCRAVPKYQSDNSPLCTGSSTCTGSGGCLAAPGAVCFGATQCASFRCVDGQCKKLPGEECLKANECANDSCVNRVCVE